MTTIWWRKARTSCLQNLRAVRSLVYVIIVRITFAIRAFTSFTHSLQVKRAMQSRINKRPRANVNTCALAGLPWLMSMWLVTLARQTLSVVCIAHGFRWSNLLETINLLVPTVHSQFFKTLWVLFWIRNIKEPLFWDCWRPIYSTKAFDNLDRPNVSATTINIRQQNLYFDHRRNL